MAINKRRIKNIVTRAIANSIKADTSVAKDMWNGTRGDAYTEFNNAVWDFIQSEAAKTLRKTDSDFDNALGDMQDAQDQLHKAITGLDKYFRT